MLSREKVPEGPSVFHVHTPLFADFVQSKQALPADKRMKNQRLVGTHISGRRLHEHVHTHDMLFELCRHTICSTSALFKGSNWFSDFLDAYEHVHIIRRGNFPGPRLTFMCTDLSTAPILTH